MRSRLFTTASLLSLVLCLGTAMLWVRSYEHFDELIRRTPFQTNSQRQLTVATRRGLVFVASGVSKGAITDQRVPAAGDRCRQLTPDLRYVWTNRGDPRPYQPMVKVTRLGFGRETHSFWAVEPLPVGRYGTFFDVKGQQGTTTTYATPLAAYVLIFAALPTLSLLARSRRAWRVRRGRCPNCSYNLVGNMSGTCPECGTRKCDECERISPS